MRQNPSKLSKLLRNAHDKEDKKSAWDMWLVTYHNMTEETFVSFEDFYKKLKTPQIIFEKKESVQDTFNRFKNKVKKVT
jgi:hypothetical protein